MKYSYLAILTFIVFGLHAQVSCDVEAKASSIDVLCGDTVRLSAIGEGITVFENDFDACNIGQGWSSTQQARYDDPCGVSKNGTCYLWFGNTSPAPRRAATNDLDLSTGGIIIFSMRYSVQGDPSPCEGPDLPDEGVSLEYSINNGATWVEIAYYGPNGGQDPNRTVWQEYQEPIPAAAQTPNTQIRWIQNAASGAGNDHWGLEDIEIVVNPPDVEYVWQHTGIPRPTGDTPPVVPTQNTSYTVDYSFGNCNSSSTVNVTVRNLNVEATIDPTTAICPGDSVQLDVIAEQILPPSSCGISPSGCVGNVADVDLGTGKVNNNDYSMFGTGGGGIISTCVNGNGTPIRAGRTQFIIRADELPGFFKGGQIFNLRLDAIAATTASNMTISMGCTSLDAFAGSGQGDFQDNLDVVYGPQTFDFNAGFNTVEFNQAYDWDGKSNIIIQVCYYGEATAQGNVFKTASGFNSTIYTQSCTNTGGCETYIAQTATLSQNRPSLRLGVCFRPDPEIVYTWTPESDVSDPNEKDPRAASESSTEYTVTLRDLNTPPECAVTASVNSVIEGDADFRPEGDGVCFGESAQLSTGIPTGTATWTGPNAFNSNDLDPVIDDVSPQDTGIYTVTVTSGRCGPVSKEVRLVGEPVPNSGTPSDMDLCNTADPIDLFNLLQGNDNGGTWSDDDNSGALIGSLVDPSNINPNSLPASFDFTYTISSNFCPDERATVTLNVERQTNAGTGGDFTFCASQGTINIFDLLIDNPESGGMWTDEDASGQQFGDSLNMSDLGGDTYTFVYTTSSGTFCPDDMATLILTINDQPNAGRDSSDVICTGNTYNLFDYLSPDVPNNGVWEELSTSGKFDATTALFDANGIAQENYTFRYVLAADLPCINDTAIINLQVFDSLRISEVSDACEDDNLGYRIQFRITGGDSANYSVNFPGTITGSSPYIYTSDIIPSGQQQVIEVSDPIGCGSATITALKSCQCVTDAGQMRTDTMLNVCVGDSAFGVFLGGYVSDIDDTLVYYLHEGNGTQLLNPVDSSHTPNFGYNPATIQTNKAYYISSAAANNRGDAWLDRQDLCFDVAPGTPVTWRALPNADINISPENICAGDVAVLSISATDGSPDFQYNLDIDPGNPESRTSSQNDYSENINPTDTTTYTITRIEDRFGCVSFPNKSATVNVNVAPQAIITTAQGCSSDLAGFDIDLSGAGSTFDFTYTNSLTGDNVDLNNQTGPTVNVTADVFDSNAVVTYTLVSVADNSGSICPGLVQGSFDLFPTPSLELRPSDGVYCQGDPIPLNYYLTGVGPWQIDASDDQGNNYNFNVNTRTGIVNITNVLNPGDYVITFDQITDLASGCSATGSGSANITVNPGPLAEVKIINPTTSNPEDALSVCENNSGIDLVFTKTQGSGAINVEYTRNGVVEDVLTISGSDETVRLPNDLAPGVYNFRISAVSDNSPASCVGTGNTVVLTVQPTPTVNAFIALSETEICLGDAFTLDFDVTGNGNISFDLVNQFGEREALSGMQSTNTHNASISPSNVGTNTYTIENVQDGSTPTCPGVSNSTFDVEVHPLPTANIISIDPATICFGGSTDITFTTTGSGTITVNYSDASGAISGSFSGPAGTYTETVGNVNPGSYLLSISSISSSTAQANCTNSSSSTATLTVNPLPNAAPSFSPSDVTCFGDDVQLFFNFNPVSYPVTVEFSDSEGGVFTETFNSANNNFTLLTADVSRSISIDRIIDANGCENNPDIDLNFTVNPLPEAMLMGDESVCLGESSFIQADLQGVAPFRLQYIDDRGNTYDTIISSSGLANLPHTLTDTTLFSLISVSDANNPVCSNSNTSQALINIKPLPNINLAPETQSACSPFDVNIVNLTEAPAPNNILSCTWTLDNGTVSNDCATFSTTLTEIGNYSLNLSTTNDLGCSSSINLVDYLRVNPNPTANFTFTPKEPDITTSLLQFYNKSSGAQNFEWNINGDAINGTNPRYQAPAEAGFEVSACLEAVSNFGCRDTFCENIVIKDLVLIYIPNAFTPDNDGINDVFLPSVEGLLDEDYRLEIFNRWGERVFVSTEQDVGWDGTYNQEEAKQDTYTIKLRGISKVDGRTPVVKYGFVNLLR